MKILFFGAGAIGTYIGGSLALAGHEIAFIERPEVAERVRRDGISVSIADQVSRIPLSAVFGGAAEALKSGPFDLCVFALKSYDTAAAIRILEPLKAKLPPVLCLQNGVENEPALESAFGSGKRDPRHGNQRRRPQPRPGSSCSNESAVWASPPVIRSASRSSMPFTAPD